MSKPFDADRSKFEDIAIVGMAGRFPGASSVDAFWANVRDGVESIRTLSDEQLLAAGVTRAEMVDPDYVKASPVLDDVDKFDASFFGFSPRDASVMDPTHRLFLEVAWQAVEHAGYTALPEEGAVGVFAGAGAPLYMIENVRTNPDLMRSMGEFLVRHTGNDMNFLATRVSYEMDLRGPSMNVQTACSSALVSLHMACQSLARGECTMALAGGSTVLFPREHGYLFKEGEILSPDGHCRPFDAKSAGTVFGSGAGVVVLKRLSDALDDGDTIHAVVKGSAINNDGAVKVGYLAPGVEGQAAVIASALAAANVSADSISYIETHGTGTLVGDPIEVEALNEAFRARTHRRHFCAIGSVKSNIGHLGEAAAAASLIKAVMALKHRQLPPSLGYETPNPAIDFENSPFFVNVALREWRGDGPLRCGVTALGAGGTNCHVILEEAPQLIQGEGERSQQLLILSAKTKTALDQASDNLASALEADESLDIADVAYTLAHGRRAMMHRRTLVVRDRLDAVAKLRERDPKQVITDRAEDSRSKTIFMFPGGGAQYASMGAELYELEDVYRDAIDECLEIINPAIGRDLRPLMFSPAGEVEQATRTLEQPSLTLPSLFATEYALARLFESWGVTPEGFIGHSVGEYAAACMADVMSLEDALRLVMMRGRLFEIAERGGMLSVPLSETDLRALMPKELDVAAANAPDLCVASGPVAAIEALQKILADRGVESTPVRIDVAAHSRMLDPVLGQFRELCKTIKFQAPKIPFVSNVTGAWITAAEATDPEYWVRHLRSTVRFAEGLATLRAMGEPILIEIGPGRTLSMLARAQATPWRNTFNCMRHPQESASDLKYALTGLGRLWAAGANIDWPAFYDGQLRNRIPLPTYPFERQSYWVEPGKSVLHVGAQELTKRSDITQWFYGAGFAEASLVSKTSDGAPRRWLVISEAADAARELVQLLAPDSVVLASAGRKLSTAGVSHWRFNFNEPDQYVALLQMLEERGGAPDHVVLIPQQGRASNDRLLARNFLHPTYLAQALGGLSGRVQFTIVTSGLSGIDGQSVDPQRAMALGPVLVAPREIDHLHARCIDLPFGSLAGERSRRVRERLVRELRAETDDQLVALRAGGRWVRKISEMQLAQLAEDADAHSWVREDGVYFITGGLGGIGLEVAGLLARSKRVKLALLAREDLPEEAHWDDILARSAASRAAQRIARVRALRLLGAQVMVVAGDITDANSLGAALNKVRAAYGSLNGVIHAAGIMDDAPLMAKDAAAMTRVLAPKVAGTLALDALVREPLDTFVLFSSVASFLGLPGQVDYTAANAFLDAFARSRAERAPGRTVVINWNAWQDIGMAASAHRAQVLGPDPALPSMHPALDGYTDAGGERTFVSNFSRDTHWLLSEHVVKGGSALLPGTGFLELARAAFAEGRASGPIELSNLTFIAPFQVPAGETRRLTIHLSPLGNSYEISMRAGADASASPLVVGEARTYAGQPPAPLDLSAIFDRCKIREWASDNGFLEQDFMDFGPRWANLRRVRYGVSEAFIELSLDERFANDLEGYGLHPAMMDMATGGVQSLIPGVDLTKDFYVPMAYGAIRVFGAMPLKVFSHVRCLPESGDGIAHFDITLSNETGRVFAQISRFTMKRLDSRSAFTAPAVGRTTADRARNDVMAAVLREAITAPEGLEAFDRIMSQPHLVQAVASSVDVNLWSRQLLTMHAGRLAGDEASEGFQRSDLAADFAAPSSPVEKALAKIWSELLGVRQVGVNDDFFDLGGNSLVGVRLFAAVRKQLQISLPLATLFETPTIAELAGILVARGAEGGAPSDEASPSEWSPLVRINKGAPGRTPIYCVHGSRGNVLVFKSLSDRLGADRPFYGLQARGVDGALEPDETIRAMAERYLAAIRGVQPKGPYLLAGYSGGGVVAYEIAQILKRAGEPVGAVIMIDTLEPNEMRTPVSMIDRLRCFPRLKLRRILKSPGSIWRYQVVPKLERLVGVKREAPPLTALEIAAEAVDAAYHRSQRAYVTEPYDGDIVLVRADDARTPFLRSGPTFGWGNFVRGKVQTFDITADHFTVFDEPAVSQMAAGLKPYLAVGVNN
ncbi:MAG: SDR family NAD(P)-dependent oxidoreductase [Hyphomonadaceae bacterium]|jgi:acyl transferase domain-containing protein/thioesterase domain-containing protein/acyl carrier protein|nr:SDR family NAD(P)-dependent oxidoreductase [Hyphomonadaceae bacterium]